MDNIRSQVAALQTMTTAELRDKWFDVFGKPAPDCDRVYLRRRLASKIQQDFYGGIREETQQKLIEIGKAPKPVPNAAGVVPGTRFEREWKGVRYVAIAREKGFEMNGVIYRSLSGIATKITGTSWNGKKFFGVI